MLALFIRSPRTKTSIRLFHRSPFRLNHQTPTKTYLPWSKNFVGTNGAKVALQAGVYALVLFGAAQYFAGKETRGGHGVEILASTYASRKEVEQAILELRAQFPDRHAVVTDMNDLATHGSSEHSYHPASPHAVIVRPKSTEDVVKIINIAREYRIPITPYSGATSLEGHFSGHPTGSICLDMSGMDKILNINVDDADMTCQAGARWEDINHILKEKGIPLFFPLDPGPGATIGGMIGTGCSGTNAVRYGTARDEWFLNLTVVLPNGEVIKTRQRARKSSAGFDTTKLFIGAEGTLGIVTEATLRLTPVLPTKVAMAQFPNVQLAVSAVQEILQSSQGMHIQCVELLDDHRDDASAKLASKVIQQIVKKTRGTLANRKYALMSSIAAHPGLRCWTTDRPGFALARIGSSHQIGFAGVWFEEHYCGHVGDGNFHALILFDYEKEYEAASLAVHRLVHRAQALDGTCTGEHGVGLGKKEYLVKELGVGTVQLMKCIKNAIDPLNIMNPGKLYPDEGSSQKH